MPVKKANIAINLKVYIYINPTKIGDIILPNPNAKWIDYIQGYTRGPCTKPINKFPSTSIIPLNKPWKAKHKRMKL